MIKLLDLYCGAGGCAVGYNQAAEDLGIEIEITGIDIEPQPNYPFTFIQGDAIEYINAHGHLYTHVHASPPCQEYSKSTAPAKSKGVTYPDLVAPTRLAIEKTGLTGVIENVPGAPIRPDVRLRGDQFGLKVLRLRWFETIGFFMMQPGIPQKVGSVENGDYSCCVGNGSYITNKKNKYPKFKKESVLETWKYAMGIEWMKSTAELSQSIPPAYTRYIGLNWFEQTK